MKNFAESVKFNSQAAKLSAFDPEVFYNLGVGQMNLGNQEAALAAFQKSIACDEQYADAYYQLGLIFLNQNKMAEALAALEKFLQVAPEDSRAPNVKDMIKIIKKKDVHLVRPQARRGQARIFFGRPGPGRSPLPRLDWDALGPDGLGIRENEGSRLDAQNAPKWAWSDGRLRVTVPRLEIHGVIGVE